MSMYSVSLATCKCFLVVVGFIFIVNLSKLGTVCDHRNVELYQPVQNDTTSDLTTLIFHKRYNHIANICLAKPGLATNIRRRHFLLNAQHKLLYCWIHKVASTSWIAAFSNLVNKSRPSHLYYREINHLAAKHKADIANSSAMAEYFKFLIVRHPFERLVSAYRDRIQDRSHKTHQARTYMVHVLSQEQKGGNVSNLSLLPTFPEFVQWLLLTRPENYDVHWNRYHDHCAPCSVKFDAVVHLEEQQYIARKLSIQLEHLQQSSGGETTHTVTCQYLSQLSQFQLDSLYDIYKLDFQMFGYDKGIYKTCNKNNYETLKTSMDWG